MANLLHLVRAELPVRRARVEAGLASAYQARFARSRFLVSPVSGISIRPRNHPAGVMEHRAGYDRPFGISCRLGRTG